MDSLRKILAGVALIVGAVAFFNYFFLAVNPAGQIIWDIIDPIIILTLAAVTLINIAESVEIRRGDSEVGRLPRDILTGLVAMAAMFYGHNYLLKLAFGVPAANIWIWHFIVPPVVVMLVFEGISLYLRDAKSSDPESG